MTLEEFEQQARALTPEELAKLAEALLVASGLPDREIEAAWYREIEPVPQHVIAANSKRFPLKTYFITWRTANPFNASTRLSQSSNRYVRRLPMCW